jgi:hypothetical protein
VAKAGDPMQIRSTSTDTEELSVFYMLWRQHFPVGIRRHRVPVHMGSPNVKTEGKALRLPYLV